MMSPSHIPSVMNTAGPRMCLWSARQSLLRGTVREVVKRLSQSFLSVELGVASVDTATAQALIVESALEGLERQLGSRGMRAAMLNLKHLPKSAGIGGCGKVVREWSSFPSVFVAQAR